MPVIPATWEAEAGESLEPGRQGLHWAKIAPLHFSLGNKSETPSQSKKKKRKRLPGAKLGPVDVARRRIQALRGRQYRGRCWAFRRG